MRRVRQRGFTLIELLVVLLIMGLLVTLGPIAFHRALPGLSLTAEARDVAAVFREARSVAIRDNREAVVSFDVQAKTYRLEGPGKEHDVDPGLGLKLVSAASEQVGENVGRIRFFPDGTSTGGRVTLSSGERKYYVVVDWLTGRVQVVH